MYVSLYIFNYLLGVNPVVRTGWILLKHYLDLALIALWKFQVTARDFYLVRPHKVVTLTLDGYILLAIYILKHPDDISYQ